MNTHTQLTTQQKARLYDFAVDTGFLDHKALFAFIDNQSKEAATMLRKMQKMVGGSSTEGEGAIAATAQPAKRSTERAAKTTKTAPPVNRKLKHLRKIQGQYLALIRRFPAEGRPFYSKLAKAEGRKAAIARMQAALD